jgi:hypothetical protein
MPDPDVVAKLQVMAVPASRATRDDCYDDEGEREREMNGLVVKVDAQSSPI